MNVGVLFHQSGPSMTTHASGEKILRPRDAVATTTREGTRGLSAEILSRSARRLRVLALMYAFTFVMAGYVSNLIFPDARAILLSSPLYWLPGLVAIAIALGVAAITVFANLPLATLMNVALVFLVVSNFGIAIAEYAHLGHIESGVVWMGLSWVGVWTSLFTVVIPTRPVKALIATIASVSSVPLVIGWMMLSGRTPFTLTPTRFFFAIVFPYVLIVALAYAGQRVVYALGKEATRAQELGSYRLIERLGKGGMGEVWRATHRLLARPAAIKLLHMSTGDGSAGELAMRRFEREAQVTSQLRSPHTVELWDFGVAGDGRFYYVMELLDGLDLDALVKRHGPIPAERAIVLLRQVCQSLAEAEGHGLVHRDIKPANILVCRYGGEYDFIKVLDFGIVKVRNAASPEAVVTQENVLRGTPAFIAPEQVLSSDEIDGRADIYSVGCVAYWLLTGDLVFRGETPIAVMMHHAHTAPVPVSERTELPIPPELDRLILSCLEKDPAKRPQSARELSRRLAAVPVTRAWNEEDAEGWWSRHEPVAQDTTASAS
jgi:eukaryotic-like serine/threonine-protein kinase